MTKDERATLIDETLRQLDEATYWDAGLDGDRARAVLEAFADKLTCRHVSQSWSCKCAICGAVIG
jgi:hypothetical protein